MMSVGLIGFILGNPGVALASNLPTGAQVVSGEIDINTVGSNTLNIVQGTQSAIVNWQVSILVTVHWSMLFNPTSMLLCYQG